MGAIFSLYSAAAMWRTTKKSSTSIVQGIEIQNLGYLPPNDPSLAGIPVAHVEEVITPATSIGISITQRPIHSKTF